MMNVLVTGGNGQLASCIKDVAVKYSGIKFIYTDYQDLDICDLNQVQLFFGDTKIDYCINCAAYTAVDKAETEVDKAFDINANGAKNLALACNESGVILIHISTDFVFDGTKTEPYVETDVANPISVYGASKLQGELEIQSVLEEYFILRTSWLYSEHGNNFMKTMLRLAETRYEIGVVSDQIGTPTYAGDLAEVIVKIINEGIKKFGVYHYSNEGAISWYDFARAIFEESNIDIKVNAIKAEEYPTLAKRPVFSVLNTSKIEKKIITYCYSWKDSLVKAIKVLG